MVNGYKIISHTSQGDREALYNFINALSDSDLQFSFFFSIPLYDEFAVDIVKHPLY